MPISELEKKRQANIARNQLLLKELEFENFRNDLDLALNTKTTSSKRSTKVKKSEKRIFAIPLRRSRRIAGVKLQDDQKDSDSPLETADRRDVKQLEHPQTDRVIGDLMLDDILKNESETIERLKRSFDVKDFYESVLKNKESKNSHNGGMESLREEFSSLKLFAEFDPSRLKLTSQRMTSIQFHPYVDRKIIVGGDKTGQIGIWSTNEKMETSSYEDHEDYEPAITQLKLHGKNISRLQINPEEPTKIYSASHDGSVRCLNLGKLCSEVTMSFEDMNGTAVGITDISFINPTVYYFTTLSGLFGQKDLREPDSIGNHKVLRCHGKKIGSLAINPSLPFQFATASLDRTLKIWDLRTTNRRSEFQDEKFHASPECLGSFTSKLSVSGVDWNKSGDIVCNGYADEIDIFNNGNFPPVSKAAYLLESDRNRADNCISNSLVPTHVLKHNCQTGRWVSILKSQWQKNPSDGIEKFIIANMNRSFDVYCSDGFQVSNVSHTLMNVVPAACCFHPTQNWIVGGSASGKCYLFDNEKA